MKKKIYIKKIIGAVAIAVSLAVVIRISSAAAEIGFEDYTDDTGSEDYPDDSGSEDYSDDTESEDYPHFTTVDIQSYGSICYDDGNNTNNNGYDHDLFINSKDLKNLSVAIEELQQAFQDGVNKIYSKLNGQGFTPDSASPDDINDAIQDMYDSRYKEGCKNGVHVYSGSATFGEGGGGTYTYPHNIDTDKYEIIYGGFSSASFSGRAIDPSNAASDDISTSFILSWNNVNVSIRYKRPSSIRMSDGVYYPCSANYFLIYIEK